jgi:hypothetical protein
MEKKSEFQIAFEGFSLIVIGVFAILFHVLKLIPESDTIVFRNLSLFDLLQMGLKTVVVILFWRHYKSFIHQISQFYSLNFEIYPETKSDSNFFIGFVHFFSLAFIYELFVPGLKYVFSKFDEDLVFVIVILECLFTLIGILLLIKTWKAYQAFIGDVSVEKNKPVLAEQEHSNLNPVETDSDVSESSHNISAPTEKFKL